MKKKNNKMLNKGNKYFVLIGMGLSVFKFYKSEKKKRRPDSFKPPEETKGKKWGNKGEEELQELLQAKYGEKVVFNRFIDSHKLEVDAILEKDNHCIFIEMKNWTGIVYGSYSDEPFYKDKWNKASGQYERQVYDINPIQRLHKKAEFFYQNYGIKADEVLVFSNKADISHVDFGNTYGCNFSELINVIENILHSKNNVQKKKYQDIHDFKGWDYYIDKQGNFRECIIESKSIILIDNKNRKEKIFLDDICLIKIKNPFFKVRPDKIEVVFRDNSTRYFRNFNESIEIFTREGNKPISLANVKEIQINPNRL